VKKSPTTSRIMVDIVSRASWGANPLETGAPTLAIPSPDIWLHHTASSMHGPSGMRALQADAITEGYVDIEYNFISDDDGVSYEGRGAGRKSAAQNAPGGADNNSHAHALCAFGNFEIKQPTDKLITGIADLVRWLYLNGYVDDPVITGPHKFAPDCATACCGKNLIARIGDINELAAGATPPPASKYGGAMDIVRTPSGKGYYIVSADGGVFCFGDAKFYGSMGGKHLNSPVVDMAVTPNGNGYMLAAADGGIFMFGGAVFHGSMGGKHLNAPIVGCDFDKEGDGYWLLAKDGGVFTFGKTGYYGSASGKVKYP
jgi:hypothetical protein